MFRHYYFAIFQEADIENLLKTYRNKMGQNKHAYILVSVAQNFTGFGISSAEFYRVLQQ